MDELVRIKRFYCLYAVTGSQQRSIELNSRNSPVEKVNVSHGNP